MNRLPSLAFEFNLRRYFEGLRELTKADGALLAFDEVMTGFRIAKGGAQEYWAGPYTRPLFSST
jgi:adenosylmethionine-8-amino-7-oxononanoate aminotransferase